MRVLVTGASGFVGRWAVAELVARGAETIGVSRRPIDIAGAKMLYCDLLDPPQMRRTIASVRPETVLHLAWNVEPGRFWAAPENLDWLSASVGIVRAAHGVATRFVGVGTCFEYQWPILGDCEEDRTPIAPTSLYAATKDSLRRVLEQCPGLTTVWARLFYLYGPHEAEGRLVSSLASNLARGEPALLSKGGVVRDFLHCKDAGAALAEIALSGLRGAINVASGEGVTVCDLAEMLGRIADRPDLIRVGALPDRCGDPRRVVGSTHRLRMELGFSPRYDLESGLRDTFLWQRAQHT